MNNEIIKPTIHCKYPTGSATNNLFQYFYPFLDIGKHEGEHGANSLVNALFFCKCLYYCIKLHDEIKTMRTECIPSYCLLTPFIVLLVEQLLENFSGT